MYGIFATMTILDEEQEAFEALMSALAAAVRANEPGNLSYHILRSRTQPTAYRIVEIYESKEAFKRHLSASHVRDANSKVLRTLKGAPQIEVVEVLA
jgi:quinol monooxygenase YgiN